MSLKKGMKLKSIQWCQFHWLLLMHATLYSDRLSTEDQHFYSKLKFTPHKKKKSSFENNSV